MGVPWETAAKKGWDSFHEEDHQEAQTPDGNQMCFLGPERIFGTMVIDGEAVLEKAFLTSLNKVESVGLTFVSPKDVYVISRRQTPELCEVVRPVVYISRALGLGKASLGSLPI